MVERSLSMREVPGSIPGTSKIFLSQFLKTHWSADFIIIETHDRSKKERDAKLIASSGNRTRAARVAGEHSTTEPTMLSF